MVIVQTVRHLMSRLALLQMICICLSFGASAHDVPTDVRINAFLKPEDRRLQLLMRVPMVALQGSGFSTRGPGYLAVSQADQALRNATKLWLLDNIDVFEDGVRLEPTIAKVRVSLDPTGRSRPTSRARAPGRAASARRFGRLLGAGAARRAARIPDPVGALGVRDPAALERLGLGRPRCCGSCPRAVRTRIRVPRRSRLVRSIRGGIRPRFASCSPGFVHILAGSTTCSSCCAS